MTAPAMRFASVPDGMGGKKHVLVPALSVVATAGGKKGKKRHVPDPIKATGEAAAQMLKQYIERYENLDEEARGIADDKKDVLAEAKSQGFDTKTMKAIMRLRQLEPHNRQEAEALLETYKASLGLD